MTGKARVSVSQRNISIVEHLARPAFEKHELTVKYELDGPFCLYYCRNPERGDYSFSVTLIPGYVFLTGDIGHLALCRVTDMRDWIRQLFSHESIDFAYAAQKIPGHEHKVRDFNVDAAKESIRDMIDSAVERLEMRGKSKKGSVAGLRDKFLSFDDQETFRGSIAPLLYELDETWYEHTFDDWHPQFLWQIFALRWWIRAYDKTKAVTP